MIKPIYIPEVCPAMWEYGCCDFLDYYVWWTCTRHYGLFCGFIWLN